MPGSPPSSDHRSCNESASKNPVQFRQTSGLNSRRLIGHITDTKRDAATATQGTVTRTHPQLPYAPTEGTKDREDEQSR